MKSIWVTASAGTGKTKALVDRVLSLLLTGHKSILCLTFTNSAANEMLDRVFNKLKAWVLLSDEDLTGELRNLIKHYNKNTINYARSLFCRLSELLAIKTIHSFCYELITDFPQEAGISHNAKILEYKECLYSQTINNFLYKAPDLGEIATDLSEKKLYDIFEELLPTIEDYELHVVYLGKLKKDLTTPEKTDRSHIINILLQGTKRDIKHAEILKNDDVKVFLNTNSGKKKISSIVTKGLLAQFSCAENLILEAQENCYLRHRNESKLRVIERTQSILKIIAQIFEIYNKLKQEYISYDEIIKLALKLLKNPKHRDWVMLSLSNKIEHILVDEAQDNSKEQWEIISLLSEDFFSGAGTNNTHRTIFIVGDVKQSIYSFQGAQPQLFATMQAYFTHHAECFNQQVIARDLNTSYRSTSKILKLVDMVFNQEKFLKAVSFSDRKIQHICHRQNEVGHVELWPLVQKQQYENSELLNNSDEKFILAEKIAEKVSILVGSRNHISGRKITSSDVMVLVRRRDIFIHYLIAALRKQNLEVVGYDRFIITDHIIIRGLISLGKVLLSPEDDLELVKVLKSPFCNLTEGEVFTLCYDRQDNTVWQRLHKYHPVIFHKINNWRDNHSNTFNLYYRIINQENCTGGYKDIIEKFLELTFERPILSDFLQFIQLNKVEVKNNTAGGVRITTVHSAKGLESPIVFLADTTEVPYNRNYITFDENDVPLYLKSDVFENVKEQANQEIYQEYIRLLYVALTRAKDELYITGCGKDKEGSWYNTISSVITI